MASLANSEQVGTNRHAGGSRGRSAARYARSMARRMPAAIERRFASARSGELEGSFDLDCRLNIAQVVRPGLCDHDEVSRGDDAAPALPEHLAHETLQTISRDGISDPRAHGHA
jgi:hypothetical protein